MDSYTQKKANYQKELKEWETADKPTRGDKPTEPRPIIFSTGDYTTEEMRKLSPYNPKILRCFDELAREAKSQGQYKGAKGGDAQLLLESYDGLLDTVIRLGKIYPGCEVNQLLVEGIQPEVISEIISTSDPTLHTPAIIGLNNRRPKLTNLRSHISMENYQVQSCGGQWSITFSMQ
ncbi:MAG: hypothetical protein WBA93_01950 [Microcoleaceae cyanobacterium]